ncbi:MAG TPA: 6-pyruvoyl-tetrahydropterin synthase-related protein [Terracidiphilus sp.]
MRRLLGPLIICIAAFIATSPDLIRGTSCGHDFDFHLASWFDARTAWTHNHLFYPHWAASPNYFAGEPRFVFYPPLTWMLGAFIGILLPWHGVGQAITCTFLALTGLATGMLARQAKLPEGAATLAGCGALFSGYSMFTAYERSAFGELAGGFWIPLLLYFVLRDGNANARAWRRAFDGSAVLLALVIAGAWLSNAPLGVMASYLLAAVALIIALLERSWAPLLRSTIAVTLGLGLSAIYLVPAAVEQRWVQIRQATDDPGLAIENSFLFGRHSDPRLELHDVELSRVSFISVIMIGLALLCAFIAWRRGRLPKRKSWLIPLVLIPIVVLLLQLPFSLPVWNMLPKLRFLQFPWRWLVVVEAPLGIFFAAAVWPVRQWLRVAVVSACTAIFLGITGVSALVFHQSCDAEDAVHSMIATYYSGQGFEGTDEYAPPGADNSVVVFGLPDACLTANPDTVLAVAEDGNIPQWDPANGHCDAIYKWQRPTGELLPEHLHLVADVPRAGFLVLHLRNYAAWRIRLNGRMIAFGADPVLPALPHRDDGLMAVPVTLSHVDITIDWAITPDQIMGRWLSGLSLLAVIGLYFVERRSIANARPPGSVQPETALPRVS